MIHHIQYIQALIGSAKREEGQTLAEYALLLALIAVAVITAVTALGGAISTQLTNISGQL
jgi:pilus assembly protein Flp/PilA